jgi:hypothetical protein
VLLQAASRAGSSVASKSSGKRSRRSSYDNALCLLFASILCHAVNPAIGAPAWPSEAPAGIRFVCGGKASAGDRIRCYMDANDVFNTLKLGEIDTSSPSASDAAKICSTLEATDTNSCLAFYRSQTQGPPQMPAASAQAAVPVAAPSATPIAAPRVVSVPAVAAKRSNAAIARVVPRIETKSASGDDRLQSLFDGSVARDDTGAGSAGAGTLSALMSDQIVEEKEQARQDEFARQQRELERQMEQLRQQERAAMQAAAAAQEQAIRQQQEAEEAQERAEREAEEDQETSAMLGAMFGAVVTKGTGNAALATQAASVIGLDANAASVGANFVVQQQNLAAQLHQQQQALQAKIAESQAQQRAAQASFEQQRTIQLAALQTQQAALQAQQAQMQQQMVAQAAERTSEQKANATRCLQVRENYVQQGDPTLNVREVQHLKIENSCSDDVWAFITDRAGNGQGGIVGAGSTREFQFFNKGYGWMKDYRGCIPKYDVDRQCAGNTDGLGAY